MMRLPPQVQSAIRRLETAGHSAYLVGGCVRDALMGRTPGDYDLTTSALPEETSLQRKMKALLLAGRKPGAAYGVLARPFR